MENEKFKARGITNNKFAKNRFVYGYPLFNGKKWFLYIFERYKLPLKELKYKGKAIIIEIIKAPDRWSEEYDIDKNKIWQNDILDDISLGSDKKFRLVCTLGKTGINSTSTHTSNGLFLQYQNEKFKHSSGFKQFSKKPYYKVIGNIHNIKVQNGK